MITFQKSLAAALLSGAVALVTPVLLHAQTTKTEGSAAASGQVQVPASNAAGTAAGANAAGAASESSGQNLTPNSTTNATTGAYGGMSTDQSTTNDVNKAKK